MTYKWHGYPALDNNELDLEEEDLEAVEVLHRERPYPYNPYRKIGCLLATIKMLKDNYERQIRDLRTDLLLTKRELEDMTNGRR